MSATTLAIIVAALVIILYGALTIRFGVEVRRARASMEGFAAKYGLPFERGDESAEVEIDGEIEQQNLHVATRAATALNERGTLKRTVRTIVRVPVAIGSFRGLTARANRIRLKDRGLKTGDPEIDEPYILDGHPQHSALAFFADRGFRDAIHHLASMSQTPQLSQGALVWTHDGYPESVEELEEIVDPMVAFAEAVGEATAAFDLEETLERLPAGPDEMEGLSDAKRELMVAWKDAAQELDLHFVAPAPGSDIAIGGECHGCEISVSTRGPGIDASPDLHALVELELPGEGLEDVVIEPKEFDWRLFGMHDDPTPVGGEEIELGDEALDDNYDIVGEGFTDASRLRSPAVIEALERLVAEDRVVEIDTGTAWVELRHVPREPDALVALLEDCSALADALRE